MTKAKILILSLLLFLAACKCKEDQISTSIHPAMYSYVFRDSSVWVYRNAASNDTQTVMLYRTDRFWREADMKPECAAVKNETYDMWYSSDLSVSGVWHVDSNRILLGGNGTLAFPGEIIFSELTQSGESNDYIKLVALYPELEIEGDTFYQVQVQYLKYRSSSFPDSTFLYWAPGVGLIREELHDTATGQVEFWDLIRYDIKQY